jgi:hypothetical protein
MLPAESPATIEVEVVVPPRDGLAVFQNLFVARAGIVSKRKAPA